MRTVEKLNTCKHDSSNALRDRCVTRVEIYYADWKILILYFSVYCLRYGELNE